jgi:Cdc6-like AAA superfamily ATPase
MMRETGVLAESRPTVEQQQQLEPRVKARREIETRMVEQVVKTIASMNRTIDHMVEQQRRRPTTVEDDEFTEEEWKEVKSEALKLLEADRLDAPDKHLSYVRAAIAAALTPAEPERKHEKMVAGVQ